MRQTERTRRALRARRLTGNSRLVLTADQARHHLQVCEEKIYRLLREGEIPAQRIGRVWRVFKKPFYDRFGWPGEDRVRFAPVAEATAPDGSTAGSGGNAAALLALDPGATFTPEAARIFLGVGERKMYALLRSGVIPAKRSGNDWLIERDAFFERFGWSAKSFATSESEAGKHRATTQSRPLTARVAALSLPQDAASPETSMLAEEKYARTHYSAILSTLEVERRYPLSVKRLMRAVESGIIKFKREGSSYYFAPAWIEEFLETPTAHQCPQYGFDGTER